MHHADTRNKIQIIESVKIKIIIQLKQDVLVVYLIRLILLLVIVMLTFCVMTDLKIIILS